MATPFGNTLLVGAGPAAIQAAVNLGGSWCDRIGLLARSSPRTDRLKQELQQHNYRLQAAVQNEKHSRLSGLAYLQEVYEPHDNIEAIWQTVVICTPSNSYREIIGSLKPALLSGVQTIILLSPGIGSNLLVKSQLRQTRPDINVISFSTYYAATKFTDVSTSLLSVLTKAVKKRVYVGASQQDSPAAGAVKRFFASLGIACTVMNQPLEAESRGITTYVHPPFFLNEFSLNEIFAVATSKKSLYKIYPEGPVSQHSIRTMVLLWQEISVFLQSFGARPFNLLKFLNDDNYPVHEYTLSRQDIEGFTEAGQIKQEYLLYIRYSAILIDPFSVPDSKGKYFDFSSVPYQQIWQNRKGKWMIPRIPLEDYQKLKLIYQLARLRQLPMPQTLALITIFEDKVKSFLEENGDNCLADHIITDAAEQDALAIIEEIGRQNQATTQIRMVNNR